MKIVSAKIVQAFLLLILTSGFCFGQPVPLDVKPVKIVEVDRTVIIKVPVNFAESLPVTITIPDGDQYLLHQWTVPQGVVFKDKGHQLEITTAPKGELTISVKMVKIDWEAKKTSTKFGEVIIYIGEIKPPTPVPPTPGPTPSDPPIIADGNRVLIIYETSESLPPKQNIALTSDFLRSYMDEKCGSDGWRIYDQDTLAGDAPKPWAEALKRAKATKGFKTPWIMISNGKSGFEGPLPADTHAITVLMGMHLTGSK